MSVFVGVLLTLAGIVTIYFNLPSSKTRSEFSGAAKSLISRTESNADVFTEADIARLPLPVQKYFRYCGYIGTPKMSYMKASFHNVDFSLGRGKSTIKIDYTQYNAVSRPDRIAYIDSARFGIPFEGLDSFVGGRGSMKGVLGKLFTLFDLTGPSMDKASLVTFLSECLLVPSAALQDYIAWEAVDDTHAKAVISYYGIEASGIFTFSGDGGMLSFTTDDREATAFDGTSEKVRWSALCGSYTETNGIKRPSVLRAVWHYGDGDLVYFDGTNVEFEYGVS